MTRLSQSILGPCLALEGKEPSPTRPVEADTTGPLPRHLPPLPAQSLPEGPEEQGQDRQPATTGRIPFFVGQEARVQVKGIQFVLLLID